MKKLLLVYVGFFTGVQLSAQVTWSGQAAEVFYNKCAECHRSGGIAPFALTDYTSAYTYMADVYNAVNNNLMPPWPADTSFQRYFHERILTQTERDIILDWVTDGGQSGDLSTAPPPPVYNETQILSGTPDLVVSMPNYMSKATFSQDDYACFSVPSGLIVNRKIKAIEIVPGNHNIVHHCLVYLDADASYLTDSVGLDCGGPTDEPLVAAYTPGSSPTIFPSTSSFSAGISMSANTNVVFAMHYPSGSFGEFDQTEVHFYFYPEPVANFREVYAAPIVQNWAFNIPANTVQEVDDTYPDILGTISMLSVFPHMHLIGDFIESYAITPAMDTIPFVRINDWDFHWQEFYFFKHLQVVPVGSDIYGRAIYNNTDSNPGNPNNPPVDIGAGFNTTDEMFLIFFQFMVYNSGDENVNVDSLNTVYLNTHVYEQPGATQIGAYPNPFQDAVNITYSLNEPAYVSIYIYDIKGRIIKKLVRGNQGSGEHKVVWDGTTESGEKAKPGIYVYSAMIDGEMQSGKVILSYGFAE